MNGTIYEEIKKNGDSKKKEKLKLFLSVVTTNILVAVISISLTSNKITPIQNKTPLRKLHPNYRMLIIPVKVLADIDSTLSENPVSLIDKTNKIIISKAYLHEMVSSSNKNSDNPSQFKIEIPEEDLRQLSANGSEVMIAIPELKLQKKILKTLQRRESHYEINL